MRKIIYIAFSIILLSLALTGCGTWNNTVDSTSHYANRGVGYVATPVVNTIGGGIKVLTGYPASRQDVVVYHKKGVVYKNSHTYTISNGKYVFVR